MSTEIKLNEGQKEQFDGLFEEAEAYKQSIRMLSKAVRKTEQRAWDKVRNWYPETKDESIALDYNSETGTIFFKRRSMTIK